MSKSSRLRCQKATSSSGRHPDHSGIRQSQHGCTGPERRQGGQSVGEEGDKVSEGDDIVELEVEGGGESDAEPEAAAEDSQPEADAPAKQPEAAPAPKKASGGKQTVDIKVPDLGGSDNVEIIEVAVSEGDDVNAEDPLITLESDKASMDVPSPHSGKIVSLTVKRATPFPKAT